MTATRHRITVGITTRDRLDALQRCVASLALLGDLVDDVIVVDDAGAPDVAARMSSLAVARPQRLRIVRHASPDGYIVARNTIMREASSAIVLSLDDDAFIVDASAVRRGVELMARHPSVAAVAFAQSDGAGSPWPATMQASAATYACEVPTFIGFAHLLRREAFAAVGGYHEAMHFYGEEKDLSLRLWHAGYRIVYLPDARVAHVGDPGGRSPARYVRYAIRNDCLFGLYNEPLPLLLVSTPVRLRRYFRMIRGHHDPGGFRWIVGDLARNLPATLRSRRAVTWRTLRRWRQVGRAAPAFSA